jgi:hygromycin-B 7''-O-kinase
MRQLQSNPHYLPEIKDRDHYKILFQENHHWENAVKHLVKKYNLSGVVKRGVLGSHIVYRVGDTWIKLMAPLFSQDMAFEISGLRVVDGKLSVKSPKVVAEGNLEGWPYVILSHIEGNPIRDVWSQFDLNQKTVLAGQIAKVTKEISTCKVDKVIEQRFVWNDFILKQYEFCKEQQRKKQLPESWLDHVNSFLQSFRIDEFQTQSEVFLHADLTFDHFLVTNGDQPRISGIIDMADCQVGHFEYELVAPAVFIFKGNRTLLRHYLMNCGFSEDQLNQKFSKKLLAWSILHRYFSLVSYFKEEMNECTPGDFSTLAEKVFPLEKDWRS